MNIDRYIAIHTHSQPWYDEIVATFEWINSTPEGHAKLEQMLALHGKPLLVIATQEVKAAGFAVLKADTYEQGHLHGDMPMIRVNLDHIPLIQMRADDGTTLHNTLARTLCHELEHSTQRNLESIHESLAKIDQLNHFEPDISVLGEYKARIKVARTDDELRALFGEVYDQHLHPQGVAFSERTMDELRSDPGIQRYAEIFEKPAIEFENRMMAYKGEKPRTMDYLSSTMEDAVNPAVQRALFIENSIQGLKTHRAMKAQAERRGSDPSEIRPDASPKPTGDNER